ncbi:MAG: hypothetical protein JSW23_05405, partial [Planctomycetota bacterium]
MKWRIYFNGSMLHSGPFNAYELRKFRTSLRGHDSEGCQVGVDNIEVYGVGTPIMLAELEVTGPEEVFEYLPAQYEAVATYSNGYTREVTLLASWTSEPENYGSIDANGLFVAGDINASGEVVLSVEHTSGGVTLKEEHAVWVHSLTELEIAGPAEVPEHSSGQYRALAHYDNGDVNDVTELVNWSVQPDTIASIDENGLLIVDEIGETQEITISAELGLGGYTFGTERKILAVWIPPVVHVPGDYNTIQAAVDVVWHGDIVVVADGVYTGDGNRDIDFKGKAITVKSENGPENCIIDCNGSEAEPHRGFCFHSGEDVNSVLGGLAIINGWERRGGGVYCDRSSPVISNCIIFGNRGGSRGRGMAGGIYCSTSNATILNCVVTGNMAGNSGGGIYCDHTSELTVKNCAITGNSTSGEGGGIYARRGDAIISNCTITGNTATGGGGLYLEVSRASISNSIFWANHAQVGTEILLQDYSDAYLAYSDVPNGSNDVYIGSNGFLEWVAGNVDADPCFVETGYWGDVNDVNIVVEPNDVNAVWVDGDYRLLESSLCIDAGDPNYVGEPGETDLDGKPRIVGGRIDMGAYEFESLPAIEAVVKIRPRTLNLASKGRWITCYIWLTEDYNVGEIDANRVLLEDEVPAERVWLTDEFAVAKFSRREVQEMLGEVEKPSEVDLVVSGELSDGTVFEGTDTIRVIDVGGGKNNEPPGKALKQVNRNRKRIKGL